MFDYDLSHLVFVTRQLMLSIITQKVGELVSKSSLKTFSHLTLSLDVIHLSVSHLSFVYQ